MYAAIRRYRVKPDESAETIKQILEGFVPLIKDFHGLRAYYVLDASEGLVATLSICENEEKVEASNRIATEWLRQHLITSMGGNEGLQGLSFQVDDPLQGPLYEGVSEPAYKRDLQLLSVQGICEVLGMGRSWVYQQIRSGQMPSVQLGGNVKVLRKDLEEYIEKHRQPQLRSNGAT